MHVSDASKSETTLPDHSPASDSHGKSIHFVRALNVPLLVGTIILVGVLGSAAYFWHKYQLRGTATLLADFADEAESNNEWRKAADYRQRYLRLIPGDVPAVLRLTQTFDKSATSFAEKQRAVDLFYSTIGTVGASGFQKEVPALRGRLIELLLELQRYGPAEIEAEKLLKETTPADGHIGPAADLSELQALAWRSLAFARLGLFESGVRVLPVEEAKPSRDKENIAKTGDQATEASLKTPSNSAANTGATDMQTMRVRGVRVAWEPDAIGPTFVQALKLNPAHIELTRQMAFVCRKLPQIGLYDDRPAEPAAKPPASPDGTTQPLAPPTPLAPPARDALADATMDRMVQENPANVRALLTRFAYYDGLAKPQPDDPADLPPEVVKARQAFALKAYTDLSDALKQAPTDLDVCLTAAQHASAALDAVGKGPNQDAAAWKTHFDEAEKYLRQAISTAPADPRPYQELGKLFLKDNRLQPAIDVFRDGLAKADKRDLELNSLLLGALIDAGQAAEAGKIDDPNALVATVQDLQRRLSPNLIRVAQLDLQKRTDLLLGRWHVAMGQFAEAIPLLSRVNTLSDRDLPADQPFRLLSSYLLGICHANLGQWEQATGFLDAATALAPTSAEAHTLAAEAWTKCGQPEQVAIHLEQAAQLNDSAELWFKLAQARLQAQLRVLPREKRDFAGVDAALQEAIRPDREEPLSDPWRAGLLQVDCLLVRSLDDAARQSAVVEAKSILSQLEQKHPDSAVLWRAIAFVYQQLNDTAAADRAVNRFAELQPKGPDSYVLRSQILAARRQYQPARDVLLEGIKAGLSSADVNVLSQALVGVSLSEGNRTLATSELKGLLKSEPNNVAILQQLAELAFEQQDFKQVEECEKKLNDLGSKGNSFAAMLAKFHRARRLLAQVAPADPLFAEGQRIAEELQRERPGWAPALLLSALAFERLPVPDYPKAIKAYEEAIRLGERRTAVYEQLIKVLILSSKFAEAQEYLTQLREFVPNVGELSALDVASTLAQGREYFDRAVGSARVGAQKRPDDPAAHLLLGQTLIAVGKQKEGEVSLKRALELNPADLRANALLFSLYLSAGRTDDARQLLSNVSARDDVPATNKGQFLAQAYKGLGDRAEAVLQLERLLEADPDNVEVMLQLAVLLADEQRERAEELLRKGLEKAPQDHRLSRGLAAVLFASGSEEDREEALSRISSGGADASDLVDLHFKAVLLARSGGLENLKKALEILGPLVEARDANPAHRITLASVYEAQAAQLLADARQAAVSGTPEKTAEAKQLRDDAETSFKSAESQYVELANTTDTNRKAANLTAYIEFLLRQNDPSKFAELEDRLKQLLDVSKDPFALAVLQVKCLKATGSTENIGPQIAEIVEPIAKKLVDETEKASDSPELIARAQLQLAQKFASIYLSVEQHAAAEPWLRKATEIDPEAYGQLAVCLAAQGRVNDAMQLCLEAAKSDPSPQAVRALASTLVLGTATSADFELADPVFAKALADNPSDAGLISNLADIRVVQGRVDDAISLYEKALALQPKSVMLLNNLATLLGEQPAGRDKALEYVDKAIQLAGAVPGLLDTKGMVFFTAGDFAKAKEWLEVATWDLGTDPRFFFHLAAACHRLGDAVKARENFQHAQKNQLDRQVLTPADQALLSELKQAYPN